MASGIYSHPGVLLEEHTNRVLHLLRGEVRDIPYWQGETERVLLEMAAALHDFGKTTAFFQGVLSGRRKKDPLSRHAYLSSLFFLNRALRWLEVRGISEEDYRLHTLLLHLIVKRHHTNLRDVYDELYPPGDRELENLRKQVESVDEDRANAFLGSLDLHFPHREVLVFNRQEFEVWLENDLEKIFRRWRRWWRKKRKCEGEDIGTFFTLLTGFSSLLNADKLEAGAGGYVPERVDLPSDAVQRYRARAFKSDSGEMDRLRERAFREVMRQDLSPDEHLYTLTLPTGMGKTLTGMAVAMKLREVVFKRKAYRPRIIYALPFLSIIDQNAQVLEDVFRESLRSPDSRALIKHHHLSDLAYRVESDEFDYGVSRLLTEGWHSEVIITTFVQLFDTLLSWRNSSARRFNRLYGSILLMDEVQALPSVYWPLIRNLLKEASERLKLYVILMTATQPYLLKDAKELVPEPERYFRALDRMDVYIDLNPRTPRDFINDFNPRDGLSYLFVANTIASAQELHRLLSGKVGEPVAFLSTEIPPYERLNRIRAIKSGYYRFAVSTQLIEAGVDVDFDVVYRDLAPMDSLIQTAGRCNRNLSSGRRGKFHVVYLLDDGGKDFAHRIYDSVLLERTMALLKSSSRLTEPEFSSLTGEYFRSVWEKGITDAVSDELWKAVCSLRFDGERDKRCVLKPTDANEVYISQFCLIEEQPYKRDVFIKLTDEAREVWEEFKSILEEMKRTSDIWKARERFNRIKPKFYQFVVSTSVALEGLTDRGVGLPVVDEDAHGRFYDPTTGFVRDERGFEIW